MTDRFSKDAAQQRIYRAFESLIEQEDAAIDLAQAALLIASIEYPDLDAEYYLAQLDALARRVRAILELPDPQILPQLPEQTSHLVVLDALNIVFFDEDGFRGNKDDYYNPDNSFLNKVLERRTGIPITLSLLYSEVARRVGIQLEGIGFPYHFMLRCQLPHEIVYIDPYEQGELMNEQDCYDRLRQITQQKHKIHTQWFEPFSRRHWLTRILNNLKKIYINQDDFARALRICDLIVLLQPASAAERRDRGLIYLQLKRYSPAVKDLTAYTELSPQANDRDEILDYIKMARQMLAMLN